MDKESVVQPSLKWWISATVSKNIEKNLQNPLEKTSQKKEISSTIENSVSPKKRFKNQISPSLDRFENALIKKRFPE